MWFHMKHIVKIEGDEYLCPWTVLGLIFKKNKHMKEKITGADPEGGVGAHPACAP